MKKLLLFFVAAFLTGASARAVEPSGTLPVLHIDTEGGAAITSKEDYIKATYWLETKGVADMGEDLGTQAEPLTLQIRGRGNYTWIGFDKKPYRLKLDKKAAVLGMNSNKHWALLAHADDSRGFLRNTLGFELSRMVGMAWTPGSKPCEVVLNGDYIGLYFLTETVRVDKKRVNVINGDDEVEEWLEANPGKEWNEYPFTALDNTGGWLVEIDNYDDADQIKVPTAQEQYLGQDIRVTYDTPSDYITEAQKQWLRQSFAEMDRLICEKQDWTGKIDLTAAAQFFIVNQLVGNYESYHGSCKMHRQRGEDTKWMFGPVWDFGSAFQYDGAMQNWIWESDYTQHWIKPMYENAAFKAEVKRLYAQLMDGAYKDLVPYAESFIETIRAAAARDYERWPQYGNDDLDQDLASVKNMLRLSTAFCNGQFDYNAPFDYDNVNIYLRGSMNDWNCEEGYRFTYTGNGAVFTLKVPSLSGEFKIGAADWTEFDMGYGQKNTETTAFPIDVTTPLTPSGANIRIDGTVSDATLVLDYLNHTLEISTRDYDAIVDVESAPAGEAAYYNLQGARVDTPAAGFYIVVRDGRVTKEYIR